MIYDVVDVDAEGHRISVVRIRAAATASSAAASTTSSAAESTAPGKAAPASPATAGATPSTPSPLALGILLLLVASLRSVILAATPGLTRKAPRRGRTKPDGFR